MTTITLNEATPFPPAAAPDSTTKGRYRVKIIAGDTWGSSAYYPAEIIERDGPAAWPVGTHMYVDHPTQTDRYDRPERSIRELAGRIDSTPVYEAQGPKGPGLYSDVFVYPHALPLIEALKDDIGVSIRGGASVEQATRAGRTGPVVTSIAEGISVDFVTRAGAGGAIVDLIESASRLAGVPAAEIAEALPGDMTADDLRDALMSVVRAAHGLGEEDYAYVVDFTDTVVYFRASTGDTSGLWSRTYTADGSGTITLTGEPVAVRVQTSYVPTDPPATPATPITENQGAPHMAEIPDKDLRELRESAATAQTQLQEAQAALAEAQRTARVAAARDAARPVVTAILAESEHLPARAQANLTEAALRAVPLNADGALDEAALRESVTAARKDRELEITEAMQAAGVGRVTGLGSGSTIAGLPATGSRTELAEARTAARRGIFGPSTTRKES